MFVIKPLQFLSVPSEQAGRSTQAGPGGTYVTPAQAAALLGVSSRTIGRWASLGHLPFITTVGGHRRFRESDVLQLLDRGFPSGP